MRGKFSSRMRQIGHGKKFFQWSFDHVSSLAFLTRDESWIFIRNVGIIYKMFIEKILFVISIGNSSVVDSDI